MRRPNRWEETRWRHTHDRHDWALEDRRGIWRNIWLLWIAWGFTTAAVAIRALGERLAG